MTSVTVVNKYKQTSTHFNKETTRLNQHITDVRVEIEHILSSLHTQRIQYFTALNEKKTQDFEIAASVFEHSSSKFVEQELNKTHIYSK